MAMTIHVDIVSAEGAIHSGLATMVFATAEMGEVGIAPRHTAFISRLRPGVKCSKSFSGLERKKFVKNSAQQIMPEILRLKGTNSQNDYIYLIHRRR